MANSTSTDREILVQANQGGTFSKLRAFLRLSGPGWLQSAITLGGGSLGGALYLGVLGGNHMLWLQLLAILIGVVMLSAIAYVTLSTQVRPYQAINAYVNPVLGVGWVTATILANMIFILPQFSLCFDTLNQNLMPNLVSDTTQTQIIVSAIIAVVAFVIVVLSFNPGWMSRLFDIVLKLLVGMIVVCFVAAIVYLTSRGEINWPAVWRGFIPDFSSWNNPAPDIAALIGTLPDQWQTYWRDKIINQQQQVIISTTATAVGINMTFLLPYSMIARGWDKPFRGLARFDLITALAIPFILVTSCIVMASAWSFHGKADENFLSNDVQQIQQSPFFNGALDMLEEHLEEDRGPQSMAAVNAMPNELTDEKQAKDAARKQLLAEYAATLPEEERKVAATLVKPNTSMLAGSLSALLPENTANLVFGLGALAMGFSTIIILMLINGYAFAEVFGRYDNTAYRTVGALAAGAMGFCWVWIWLGQSRTWLIIVASTFAAILLPIAYLAFFLLMNNRRLLGEEKPQGWRMSVWNVLMLIGVAGALAQAIAATTIQIRKPETGSLVIGAVATFLILMIVGFSARTFRRQRVETPDG